MVTLTDDLRRAIEQAGGAPVRLIDPTTNAGYVLVPEDTYRVVRGLLEDQPLGRDERLELLRRAGERADWDDPAMDVYDDDNRHHP
jgi:hypothetical protein